MLRTLREKSAKRSNAVFRRKSGGAESRSARFGRLAFEPLEARLVLDSTVVFNEIMYNPEGPTDDTLEWIELYNQLAVDMDIAEWRLEGAVDYEFPDGTVVPGHGFLVVAVDPTALQGVPQDVEVLGPYTGQLSNGGEEIRLVNNSDRLMNSVDYNDRGDWPVGPDGAGVTLAKINRNVASEPAESWTHSAEIGGTPGAENFTAPQGANRVTETLLTTGAPVTALVPSDDTLGLDWTEVDFDDSTWTTGTTGVGYEHHSSYDPLLGLDVESPPDGQPAIPMDGVNATIYVRVPFLFNGDPAQVESLTLGMKYDDGFVAYLNGDETSANDNAPGHDGNTDPLEWNSDATGGNEASATSFDEFDITGDRDLLEQGDNVLAIHGLNTSVSGSSDMLVLPELVCVRLLPDPESLQGLVINEVPPANGAEFWVEIANQGDLDIALGGFLLQSAGLVDDEYVLPAQTLSPGDYLVVTEAELGFRPEDDDRLFLYGPGKEQFVDAQVVTNSLRGRSEEHGGQWLYPTRTTTEGEEPAPTPGSENVFVFHDEIVINEIMYHAPPTLQVYNELFEVTQPFEESDEEWIELYNRGATTVDLSGWQLDEGIGYTFEPGTTLDAGEYLVVARDAAALRAKYPDPEVRIVGNFSRSLNNADDRIMLVDAHENPVDDVHYFERGRWPAYADGGGSSLELIDPDSDNSQGEAWAASNERDKAEWIEYEYKARCSEPLSVGATYNEFIFGMLDSGEFLIDDVHVRRDPDGANAEMMQNGSFDGNTPGYPPSAWRLIGNHSGIVELDPDDPSNRVLHVTAAGAQQHVHDHAETTFINNTSISDGTVYEISFRARWLAGNSQLNNRFSFSRMSNTAHLDVPEYLGTPGAQNSTYASYVGPTYREFAHAPILPAPGEPVTVSVRADDPDGVGSMTLYYLPDGSGASSRTMVLDGDGYYRATIPGQTGGRVVQFYVQGTDGQGATSTFPAGGRASRALYQVDDGRGPSAPIDTLRLVTLTSDNNEMFSSLKTMSNDYVGCSVIHNGDEAFYDAEIRQVGSGYIRPGSGFKVRLQPGHKFYGVHPSIRVDRSGGGDREIYMKHMVNRAGGSYVSMYDDISYVISTRYGAETDLFQLARYDDLFLNEQFENGSDGSMFELDDVTYPRLDSGQSTEDEKTGHGMTAQDIVNRGLDPEMYRGQLLIKSNRSRDDFLTMAKFATAIHLNGDALDQATQEIMDVDLWMRHYATQAFLGNWDTYGFNRPKNLRMYIRPEDGKVIPMYWDADLANLTDSLIYNGGSTRLDEIRNIPHNKRLFWGHMWDLVNRSFNLSYMDPWLDYYRSLGAPIESNRETLIANRETQVRNQARSTIPQVPFRITTQGGADFSIDAAMVTIEGDGWINVREIRLAGSDEPLDVTWTDQDSWEVTLPIEPGPNPFNFEAYSFEGRRVDYQGNPMGSHTITVTSTMVDRPLQDSLRITELNYNPADPTPEEEARGFLDSDDFEFIEVQNIGDEVLDVAGIRFIDGIEYEFVGTYQGPPLLITEAGTGDDYVEIQNVSEEPAYTSGWVVAVNHADGRVPNINNVNPVVWQLPDSIAEGEVQYRHDNELDPEHYWGENIFFRTADHGWVMIVDELGNVADFVVWGYTLEEIEGFSVNVNGFDVTAAGAWFGEAIPSDDATVPSLQRVVGIDSDGAVGWDFVGGGSMGEMNVGLSVPFPPGPLTIGPGEVITVAKNRPALRARYGAELNLIGPYDLNLSDGGERITLVDTLGAVIIDFEYGDSNDGGWPGRADGKGATLELIDPSAVPQNSAERLLYLETPGNWRSSDEYLGSPGLAGTDPFVDVLVNEVLTHTDVPLSDAVELINTSGAEVDVSGWYLSDSWGFGGNDGRDDYKKFRIPDGTVIPAGCYVVFDEDDFNPTPTTPQSNHFAFDGAHGEDVWLMQADAEGNLTRFVDHVEFGAAINGESFGLWPNGEGDLYPMLSRTLDPGRANSGPRVGPLIISEVQYNPGTMLNADELEFIEIYNPTGAAVDLTNWRIRKGIDFDFAPGTMLASETALVVVPFNPADTARLSAFYDHYGIDGSVQIVGGYTDVLDNGGERVQLQRPDEPPATEPGFIPHLLEDEVRYDDDLPWPIEADGNGRSLHRAATLAWGHDVDSWDALAATPGTASPSVMSAVVGRHIFYNRSAFDNNQAAPNALDDLAIASDKEALLPGGTAVLANYTSYLRGINGVMVDMAGLADGVTLEANDFRFRVGNHDDPSSWATAPTPTSITVRQGDGNAGSDRVTIIFNDNAIRNQWLEVTVLATSDTRLVTPDVFYFGNAVGESGNSASDAKVNATDVLLARNNPRTFLTPPPIDFHFDYNRDKRVNATDLLIARTNQTTLLDALKLITVPAGKGDGAGKPNAAGTTENQAAELAWIYDVVHAEASTSSTSDQVTAEAIDELLAGYLAE